MNKNIVDIKPSLPQLYNLDKWKGSARFKYLKQLMKLIKKYKIKDNKILNIHPNDKRMKDYSEILINTLEYWKLRIKSDLAKIIDNFKYPISKLELEKKLIELMFCVYDIGEFYNKSNKKIYNKLIENKEYIYLLFRNMAVPSLVTLDYYEVKTLFSRAKDISFQTIPYKNYKKVELDGIKSLILIFLVNSSFTLDKLWTVEKYFSKEKCDIIFGVMVVTNLKKEEPYISIIKLY